MGDIHNPWAKIKRCKSDDESFYEKEDAEAIPCTDDRISELPEFIIHHILSFLDSPSDVTKTSILSKRWYHSIYASFPELYFSERHLSASASENKKFLNFVDESLSRYQSNGFRTSKFCLRIRHAYDISSVNSFVYKWIVFLLKNQIEELDISLHADTHEEISFILPPSFFSMSKLLKSVRLHGCGIESPWSMDHTTFGSLQSLSLWEVFLRDEILINYIIHSCPLLEKLTLHNCHGLKNLQLYGLNKLRFIDLVTLGRELSVIDINAPSLQSFRFSNRCLNSPIPKIEMGSCKNLRFLRFSNVRISDWPLHDLINQFPLLEDLALNRCMIQEVRIRSDRLKVLVLLYCHNLKKVELETPNLLSFDFYCKDRLPLISSTNLFGNWEAKVNFIGNSMSSKNTRIMLRELREFLLKSKHFKLVTLYNFSFVLSEAYVDESSTEGFELEHLKLRICLLSKDYAAALEGLLLCCRPHALSLEVTSHLINSPYTTNFIKDIYKKLSHEGCTFYGCCGCWNQYVKKVEIELFDLMSEKMIPIELADLSDSLPTIKNQEIHFRLNW